MSALVTSWQQATLKLGPKQISCPPKKLPTCRGVIRLSGVAFDRIQGQRTTKHDTHTHAHIHTLKRILYTSSCRLLNSRGIAYSAINIWNNMNLFAIIYIHLATCGDLTRLPWTPSLSPVHLPQPELLLASLATNHRYKVRTWTWRPW
jgi:hypothetical protein